MSKKLIIFVFILLSIGAFFILNLFLGTVRIPFTSIVHVLFNTKTETEIWTNIIWKSRFPQTLTAVIAGMGLSISGLMMQTVFRNPLAGPSELGISSGASLGVALVVLLSGGIAGTALSSMGFIGEIAISIAAIIGALSIMSVILVISQHVRGIVVLLIVGVMIGYIANAFIGVLKFFSNEEDVKAFVIWGLGSFAKVSDRQVYTFLKLMMLVIPVSFLLIKSLNLILLGDMYAKNLGLNLKRSRFYIILISSILTALVTAYCGPIIFLGLAVPHLCRILFSSSDHRILMPAVALTGASLSLLCNLIARLPGFEGALPINAVTALIGAPVVLYVLFKKRKTEFE